MENFSQCNHCGSILPWHAIPGRVSVVARRGLILLLDGGLWLLTRQFLTTSQVPKASIGNKKSCRPLKLHPNF